MDPGDHPRRAVHLPSLRNIWGVSLELQAGLRALSNWHSRVRWAADILLQRLPPTLQGPHRKAVRTIRLRDGVSLRYRLNRGDLQSIREVWLAQVYCMPEPLGSVDTVVDLGANIGMTSVYLARRHTAQRLVAVEPVPANARLVRQNLEINGIRGEVIEAVVAATDGTAYFQDTPDSNLGHRADAGREVRALSMRSLMASLDTEEIDILKVDIEGAEADLFAGERSWLRRVRSMMIEFHPEIVDSDGLTAILEAEGFRHLPAGSVRARSADAFIRDARPGTP